MKPKDRWFYRGMACAAAVLARRDEPTLAVDCLESNGVTLEMLRAARVEPFDLAPLVKAWRAQYPRAPAQTTGRDGTWSDDGYAVNAAPSPSERTDHAADTTDRE